MSLNECLQSPYRNNEERLVLLKVLRLMTKTRHNVKLDNLDLILWLCVPFPWPGMGQETVLISMFKGHLDRV